MSGPKFVEWRGRCAGRPTEPGGGTRYACPLHRPPCPARRVGLARRVRGLTAPFPLQSPPRAPLSLHRRQTRPPRYRSPVIAPASPASAHGRPRLMVSPCSLHHLSTSTSHPSLSFSSLFNIPPPPPSSLLSTIQHHPSSFPSIHATPPLTPSILVLPSCSPSVRLWLDTSSSPYTIFPRTRNDQTSYRLSLVIIPPPDTV